MSRAGAEDVMVDGVESSIEVKETQKCHLTRVRSVEYVRQNLNKARPLGRVVSAVSRLE